MGYEGNGIIICRHPAIVAFTQLNSIWGIKTQFVMWDCCFIRFPLTSLCLAEWTRGSTENNAAVGRWRLFFFSQSILLLAVPCILRLNNALCSYNRKRDTKKIITQEHMAPTVLTHHVGCFTTFVYTTIVNSHQFSLNVTRKSKGETLNPDSVLTSMSTDGLLETLPLGVNTRYSRTNQTWKCPWNKHEPARDSAR